MIRRLDLSSPHSSEEAAWVRDTAQKVYLALGEYGKIIPGWMNHPGVLTYLDVDDAGTRRGFILVGFYEPSDSQARLVADLLAIAVAPEYQRQGVGRTLLDFAIDLATEASANAPVTEIRLTVADTNHAALALFHRAGFEILDANHGAYDGGQRAIRMRRKVTKA